MKDDPIPDDNHVSRYVPYTKLTPDGCRVSGAAFQLRPDEDALSVNWLEYFDLANREAEIQEVRKVFADKGRTLQAKAKFAILEVGATKEYVQQESDESRLLSILHDPLPPEDESHASIYNVPRDAPAIGDMIAELIEAEAIYPARDPSGQGAGC